MAQGFLGEARQRLEGLERLRDAEECADDGGQHAAAIADAHRGQGVFHVRAGYRAQRAAEARQTGVGEHCYLFGMAGEHLRGKIASREDLCGAGDPLGM